MSLYKVKCHTRPMCGKTSTWGFNLGSGSRKNQRHSSMGIHENHFRQWWYDEGSAGCQTVGTPGLGNRVSSYWPKKRSNKWWSKSYPLHPRRVTWIKTKRERVTSGCSGALKPDRLGLNWKANKCRVARTGNFGVLTTHETLPCRAIPAQPAPGECRLKHK